MKQKITLEYVKFLHNRAVYLEDKIIYLASIIEELRYLELLNEDKNIALEWYIKPIVDLRNNILHLRENSLDKDVWSNRQLIYDNVTKIISRHLL